MSPDIRIALLGFTAFERAHIEAALQPNDEPGPRYLVGNDLMACSLAVVNADDEAAVERVTQHGRLGSTLMLGTTPRPGAAVQLGRPINLVQLLRALHTLTQEAPPMSAAVQRVQEDLARMRLRRPAPSSRSAPSTLQPRPTQPAGVPIIEGRSSPAAPRKHLPAGAGRPVLVVDDEEHTLRLLATELPALGFEVQLVRTGAQALERLARRPFDLVLLATGLDGMDSFHTCKTIKRQTPPGQRTVPAVVMLVAPGQAVERLRAEMAGADLCLDKPVDPVALRQVLAARPTAPRTEVQTTLATSTQI
jgi:CheY-like chemotaxis protein